MSWRKKKKNKQGQAEVDLPKEVPVLWTFLQSHGTSSVSSAAGEAAPPCLLLGKLPFKNFNSDLFDMLFFVTICYSLIFFAILGNITVYYCIYVYVFVCSFNVFVLFDHV